jgi:hypothetical protein
VPVTTLDRHVGESTIRAVVERWRSLSDGQRPTTVAVVGSTPRANAAAADVVARLSAVCVADESVVLATSLGSGGVELTAIAADLVVFVTVPGDRLVEARRAARTLSQLGAGPKWAIFAMPE